MRTGGSQPIFNVPAVVLTLLGAMVLVQVWQATLGAQTDLALVTRLAFVPGRLSFAFDPVAVMRHLANASTAASPVSREQAVWAAVVLRRGGTAPWTLLTYAFLHGGWAHLGFNGIWMVAFGTPVARRFGTGRFLVFMAVAAVWGAIAHWICYPFGFMPVVGASAAISGLMGAAVRFMFQGAGGTRNLHDVVPLRFAEVFRDRRAVSFVAIWFATNALFGVGAGSLGFSDAPVAWQAHIGGFLAGLLLFPWFDPVRPAGPEQAAPDPLPDGDPMPSP